MKNKDTSDKLVGRPHGKIVRAFTQLLESPDHDVAIDISAALLKETIVKHGTNSVEYDNAITAIGKDLGL